MAATAPARPRLEAFAGLRERLAASHREATAAAFVRVEASLLATGFAGLDEALGGGFPRGTIVTVEGPVSSGRSALGARLLARATAGGLGALIEKTGTTLYPPALAEAGVALERLLVVPAPEPLAALRAADIVLRSGAFGVVAIPAFPLKAEAWTRLASLAHRTNALVVALGTEASNELRYFASVRVQTRLTHVRWSGGSGPFATLAGYDVRFEIVKHKRAAPGKSAFVSCGTFDAQGPSLSSPRERVLRPLDADRLRVRSVV